MWVSRTLSSRLDRVSARTRSCQGRAAAQLRLSALGQHPLQGASRCHESTADLDPPHLQAGGCRLRVSSRRSLGSRRGFSWCWSEIRCCWRIFSTPHRRNHCCGPLVLRATVRQRTRRPLKGASRRNQVSTRYVNPLLRLASGRLQPGYPWSGFGIITSRTNASRSPQAPMN